MSFLAPWILFALPAIALPVVIHLMMQQPNQLWGDPVYPVVKA